MKPRKKTAPVNPAVSLLVQFGPMRLVLAGLALTMMSLIPAKGSVAVYHGWALVPTVLIPMMVPILFMVLMLDVLMSSVFMIDKQGAARARYRTILFVELILAAGLVLFWVPYFRALNP